MKKILMMGARKDEATIAEKWAKKNHVKLTISNDILNDETYHLIKGHDGLSLQQTMGIPKNMYKQLKESGIHQIAQRSAGVDMYDLNEAKEQGLSITNVPAYSPNAVAEFAVSSILNCLRHAEPIRQRVASHDFSWNENILSKEVRSLTIGILGTGRIGQVTAQLLKGFGANVIGYDLYPSENAKQYLTYVDSFDDFLQQSDVISIHMPLTDTNHHLFNREVFSKMNKGTILINAARGAIVDTKALLEALDDGTIACCALDTYENEMPYVTKDWSDKEITDDILLELINRESIYYTPHIAFYTETAVENLVEGALSACLSIMETGTANSIVNP